MKKDSEYIMAKNDDRSSIEEQNGAPRQGTASEAGIALVAVLVTLVALLMLGIGALVLSNSNLMIAENQASALIAKSNAEAGIDAVASVMLQAYQENGNELPAPGGNLPQITTDPHIKFVPPPGGIWYERLPGPDQMARFRVVGNGPPGRNAEYQAEAIVKYSGGSGRGGNPVYEALIVACDSLDLNGSGTIDSFNSFNGPYNPAQARAEGHVRTLSSSGNVTITGGSPLHGDIAAKGNVAFSGSGMVYGDIHAEGNITFGSGSATYQSTAMARGNINFTQDSKLAGDVLANGDISFSAWNSKGLANVRAGGNINYASTQSHHVPNGEARSNDSPHVEHIPDRDCDPLNLKDVVAAQTDIPTTAPSIQPDWWPYVNWEITPKEILKQNNADNKKMEKVGDAQLSTVFPGQETDVLVHRVPSMNLTSGETLRVRPSIELDENGNERVIQDVVIIVDGDFTGAGNFELIIEPGMSLSVMVKGKTSLGASFKVTDGKGGVPPGLAVRDQVDGEVGPPSFSIYSSYESAAGNGVTLNGNGKLTAAIYAPYSNVSLGGSGELFGSVIGKNVSTPGGTGIHFDEALKEGIKVPSPGEDDSEPELEFISRR